MKTVGGKSLQRELKALAERIDREVNDAVDDALDATEESAKARLIYQDTVHTGALYHSFVKRTIGTTPNTTRHTLDNIDYKAPLVEWGTGGYFAEGSSWGFRGPPMPYRAPTFSMRLIYAILGWIITKPGFRSPRDQPGPPRDAAPAIAKAIADGSETRPPGTPPQPFMRPAWAKQKAQLPLKTRSAVKRAVRRT